MDEHASKIAKGSLSVFISTISILVVGVLYNPILVRLIGKAAYGDYATLLSIFGIATPLVTFGLFNSIRKHMGEHVDDKNEVAGAGYLLSLIYSALSVIFGLSIVYLLDRIGIFTQESFYSLIVIVLALSIFTLYDASRSILYGIHKENIGELMRVLKRLLESVLALLLVYFGFGLPGIFLGSVIALSTISLFGFLKVKKDIKIDLKKAKMGYKKYKSLIFSFGGLTVMSLILAQGLYHSDILLTRFFLNNEKVGAYKASLVLAELLWMIPMASQRVLLHHVSEMWSKDKKDEIINLVNKIAKYITMAMILTGFGLWVLADPFVKMYYSPKFGESVLPLRILIFGSLGFGLARILNPVIEGTGHIKKGIKISSSIVALNIILNIILIPIYGIIGAAIATGISYFAKLIQYTYLLRKAKINVMRNFPSVKIVILGSLFLVLLYSTLYLPIPEKFHLIIIPLIGLILFGALSKALKLWNLKELKSIISLLK
ncbi:MAG: polysaccharide biosynthesis C-terminal domain-containing protein [Candidatus Thermoplasmatota archaeon]